MTASIPLSGVRFNNKVEILELKESTRSTELLLSLVLQSVIHPERGS